MSEEETRLSPLRKADREPGPLVLAPPNHIGVSAKRYS